MDYQKFIDEQIAKLAQAAGDATAINALSGGVDSWSRCWATAPWAIG